MNGNESSGEVLTEKRRKKKIYLQRDQVDKYTQSKRHEKQSIDDSFQPQVFNGAQLEQLRSSASKGDTETNDEQHYSSAQLEAHGAELDANGEYTAQQHNATESTLENKASKLISDSDVETFASTTNSFNSVFTSNSANSDDFIEPGNDQLKIEETAITEDGLTEIGKHSQATKNWEPIGDSDERAGHESTIEQQSNSEDSFDNNEKLESNSRTEQLEAFLRAQSVQEEEEEENVDSDCDVSEDLDEPLDSTLEEAQNLDEQQLSTEDGDQNSAVASPPFSEEEDNSVQLCESIPVSPSDEMMKPPVGKSRRSPVRSSSKHASSSSMENNSSSKFRRSRTVLYFDSDDDEEGTSHIKESVVLEEEEEEDLIGVGGMDEEQQEVESGTAGVLPNEMVSEDHVRSESRHTVITRTLITDADNEDEKDGESLGEDEADYSTFVILKTTDKDSVSVHQGTARLQSANASLPRRPKSAIASGALKMSLQSRKEFCNFVEKHTTQRLNSTIAGFASREDEYERLIPNGKVTLLCATWNMAEGRFLPDNISDLLYPSEDPLVNYAEDSKRFLPDIFVISTQESSPERSQWVVRLQETIGPTHVLAHMMQEGVLYMCVFVRRDLIFHLSQFENCFVQTRAAKQFKTKGALGVAFYLFGTSFLLVNSHLTPHENRLQDRIRDYQTIVKNLSFPKTLNSSSENRGHFLRPPPASPNLTERTSTTVTAKESIFQKFDYVIWMGDLNFRLKLNYDEIKRLVRRIMTNSLISPSNSVNVDKLQQNGNVEDDDEIAQESLSILIAHDQLNISKTEGTCFAQLTEPTISFLPTYKFDLFSDIYDSSGKKRCPAFTDRILYSGKKQKDLKCLLYDSCMLINTSDHKPLVAVFETSIERVSDELQERICLGSGYFDHDVYSKAINRNRERSLRNSRLSLNSIAPPSTPHLNAIAARNHSISSASSATSNICSIQ